MFEKVRNGDRSDVWVFVQLDVRIDVGEGCRLGIEVLSNSVLGEWNMCEFGSVGLTSSEQIR